MAGNVQSAKRDVERITAQIANAHGDDEKAKLQMGLWEARGKLEQADFIAKRVGEVLDGSNGLVSNQGKMRAAETAQKTQDWPEALQLLEQVQEAYLKFKNVPEQYQAEFENQRDQWLKPIAGSWSNGDCSDEAGWIVKYPSISIVWPKHGTFEEKILDVSASGVITVIVSPEKYKGRLYRYQVSSNSLELSEVNSGRREVMRRCK